MTNPITNFAASVARGFSMKPGGGRAIFNCPPSAT